MLSGEEKRRRIAVGLANGRRGFYWQRVQNLAEARRLSPLVVDRALEIIRRVEAERGGAEGRVARGRAAG